MAGLMPSSGDLRFSDLQSVFGGAQPISMSEYYRGGAYVMNVSSNNAIPTSGQIRLGQFYGTGNATLTLSPASINNEQFRAEPWSGTLSMSSGCTASGTNVSSGSWTHVGGSTFNLNAPNSLGTSFQWSMTKNTERNGTYRFSANNGLSKDLPIRFYFYTDL